MQPLWNNSVLRSERWPCSRRGPEGRCCVGTALPDNLPCPAFSFTEGPASAQIPPLSVLHHSCSLLFVVPLQETEYFLAIEYW